MQNAVAAFLKACCVCLFQGACTSYMVAQYVSYMHACSSLLCKKAHIMACWGVAHGHIHHLFPHCGCKCCYRLVFQDVVVQRKHLYIAFV